jgi:hypothetical protein
LIKSLLIMAEFSISEATLQLGGNGTTAAIVSVESKAGSISFDDNKIHLVGFSGTLSFAPKPTGAMESADGKDLDDKDCLFHEVVREVRGLHHDGEGGLIKRIIVAREGARRMN